MEQGSRVALLVIPSTVALATTMLFASCGNESEQSQGDSELQVVTSGIGDGGGSDAQIAGEVTLDGDCLLVATYPAVWPQGTTWDAESQALVLPNGESVAMGESVLGGGGYPYVEDLRDEFSEDEAAALADCAGPTNEVAYFNEGSEITRVTD